MKKVLAMLLVLTMVASMLVGCGSREDTTDKNDSTVVNTQDDKAETTTPSDDEEEDTDVATEENTGDGEDALVPGVYLPVSEEKVNFTAWVLFSNNYLSDPNEIKAVQELEARTNVHIDWVAVSPLEAAEKYGLMLAAGDVPDMVKSANVYYPGGMAKAIEDGIYMDVTEEIPQYMPNYMALVESSPEAQKGIVSDDGKHYGVWHLNADDYGLGGQKAFIGMMIRQDWLDDLGLAMPETIDEWHTVLTAFKNEKGADAPLMIGSEGVILGSTFASAFGVMTEFYVEDGNVKYGPAEQGYKEYLDTFRQWYAEGLIDPNFTANNAYYMADNAYMATGRAGAGSHFYIYGGNTFLQWGMTTDEHINFTAAPTPVLNKGDVQYTSNDPGRIVGDLTAFSTDIENLEVALKWIDYQFTEEGAALMNYGIEGDSYYVEDTGSRKYHYTDAILSNPEYTPTDAISLVVPKIYFGRYLWSYEAPFYAENVQAIQDVWTAVDDSKCIANEATMTEEEGNVYNSTYTNIKTLVTEFTVNYILGQEDDSQENFDAFVENLYQYGLQDCIDAKQGSVTRYNNR